MDYTVEEAAEKLNVSKVAIYNKIKLPEFRTKIIKKHGKSYIPEDLLKFIKDNLKVSINLKDDANTKNTKNDQTAATSTVKDDEVNFNKEQINFIKGYENLLDINKNLIETLKGQLNVKDTQLQAKDIQIHELSERLKQEQKLLENSQVLLKDKPKPEVLKIEEHVSTWGKFLNWFK